MPDNYIPPRGSQVFPHPRTVPDLLLRTLFIHLCSCLAYAQFQHLLSRFRPSQKPPSRFLLPILSVLVPELIFFQIETLVVEALVGRIWGSAPCSSSNDAVHLSHRGRRSGLARHLLLALVLLIPLSAAAAGYRERLQMRYHEADFVGNLGLDHRNGWAVISGLTCIIASFLLIAYTIFTRGSHNPAAAADIEQRSTRQDEKLSPPRSRSRSISQENRNSPNGHAQPLRPASLRSLLSAFSTLDTSTTFALLGATIVHQFPLLATNIPSPVVYILVSPLRLLLCTVALVVCLRVRARRSKVSSTSRPPPSGRTVLLDALCAVSLVSLAATVAVQAYSDVHELWDVSHGIVLPWNYRWRIKDVFSHGDNDRVYMG